MNGNHRQEGNVKTAEVYWDAPVCNEDTKQMGALLVVERGNRELATFFAFYELDDWRTEENCQAAIRKARALCRRLGYRPLEWSLDVTPLYRRSY